MRLPLTDPSDNTSVDIPQTLQMMREFIDNGFTYFDTAYMYHRYTSESIVRDVLVKNFPRDSFTLANKLPIMYVKEEADLAKFFEGQIEKCGVEYFDYYMLHGLSNSDYDSKVQAFCAFEYISELKRQGRVREIGFSYHDNAELLDRILTDHPEVDFVQLQINYLDWDDAGVQSRLCYETATRHGVKVFVMEPVKGGTLAKVPEAAERVFKNYAPDASVASWAVKYAASLPNVAVVLSGMSNLEQLRDNMSFTKDFTPLSEAEYEIIDKATLAIKGAVEIPCTACAYCVDGCPMNIAIPEYFTLYNTEKLLGSCGFSTQREYYSNTAEKRGKASECISCGLCEEACPQHLPIREHLKNVADVFEK